MLALVTDAFGGNGGISQYNRDFLTAFCKADHDNRVVALPRVVKKQIRELPTNIVHMRPRRLRIQYALVALLGTWLKGPFNILFCGHLHLVPLAALLARIHRLPIWLQIHGIEAWRKPSLIVRWAAEQATLVTSVSRYTRRKFLAWANVSPDRVRVLPNTVGDEFTPGPKAEVIIDRYGLQGKKVLLTTGRMSATERYKGHDKVISSLPDLLQKHPDLIYLIAGDGDDLPRLEAIASDLGVQQYVLFVGRISNEELIDLYRTADVFVMPSTGEGFGIVFLEAMACGTPVVGSKQDGSMDPFHDGILGAAVDSRGLVEAIENALSCSTQDSYELSNRVRRYFGKTTFREQIKELTAMINRSQQPPPLTN